MSKKITKFRGHDMCIKKKAALDKANEEYYDINSPHYKDNERFRWAVESINKNEEQESTFD